MKLVNNLKNEKLQYIVLAVLIIVSALAILFFFPIDRYIMLDGSTQEEEWIILPYEDKWVQNIEENEFDAIAIQLATYYQTYEDGVLKLRFYEKNTGETLEEIEVSAKKIRDNQFLHINLDGIKVKDESQIIMELWMEEFDKNLALYCTEEQDSVIMKLYKKDMSKSVVRSFIIATFFILGIFFSTKILLKTVIKKIKLKKYILKKFITLSIFGGLLIWLVMFLISLLTIKPLENEWYTVFFIITVLEVLLMIVGIKKKISEKPEVVSTAIILLVCSYLSVSFPLGEISWDDHIHYSRSLEISHFYSGSITFGEAWYQLPYLETVGDSEVVSLKKNELNLLHNEGDIQQVDETLNLFNSICYIPAAVSMFFGRLVNMPLHSLYYMGRLGMVPLYAFLIYQAMKRLKSGKMILAVIALFPTNLFLAATYSYDPWVTGFAALGVACIVSELQQPEKKISFKEVAIMLFSFLMVGSAKAIYFPLVALAYFIKKDKFENKKQYQIFVSAVTLTIVVLIASYLVPMFITETNEVTDLRGGSDVNATGQIAFILSNPIEYTKILLNFLKGYLSIEESRGFMTFFAYLGHGSKFEILLILLGIVVITDKNEYDANISKWYRITSVFLAFCAAVLIATALYISFTPVALSTINGVQPRYLIPLLFPVLSMLGSRKIQNNVNKTVYTLSIYVVQLYVIICCVWKTCILLYL